MRRVGLCLLLAAFAGAASAADISVTGAWWPTLDRTHLSAGPGSDFVSSLESAAGVATIRITGTSGPWRVEIERGNDSSWPTGVEVAVRLSDSEAGVTGGTTFVTLTHNAQTLIEGTGDHETIELQFRVQGATVLTLSGDYSLMLTYRIVSL